MNKDAQTIAENSVVVDTHLILKLPVGPGCTGCALADWQRWLSDNPRPISECEVLAVIQNDK